MGKSVTHYFATIKDVEDALEKRLILGQAQGILMERLGLTPERAFAFLSRVSQQTNTKLEDLAAELVETRIVPRTMPSALDSHVVTPRSAGS